MIRACAQGPTPKWASSVHGGVLRDAFRFPAARQALQTVSKVKAHVRLDGLSGEELFMARGNDAADRAAKAARQLHPQSPPGQSRSAAVLERDALLEVKHLAQASARWPAAGARLSFSTRHVAGVRQRAIMRR